MKKEDMIKKEAVNFYPKTASLNCLTIVVVWMASYTVTSGRAKANSG
jgi:hypothetical protein